MKSEDDTDFISEHFAEGKALREHGLVDKAAEQFDAIVARFPDNREARQELRELYEERNQPALPPGLASVLEWVDHFISNGFIDEARDALREARERPPNADRPPPILHGPAWRPYTYLRSRGASRSTRAGVPSVGKFP